MKKLSSYIFESDIDEALKLLKKGADINAMDEVGIRPISSAINSDKSSTLQFVIDQGADVNIDDGAALSEVIDCCIDGMLQNNLDKPDPEVMEMLKILLDNGGDLTISNPDGQRPIDVIKTYAHGDQNRLEELKRFFRPIISNIDELIK